MYVGFDPFMSSSDRLLGDFIHIFKIYYKYYKTLTNRITEKKLNNYSCEEQNTKISYRYLTLLTLCITAIRK
jgi:hypothetical protein